MFIVRNTYTVDLFTRQGDNIRIIPPHVHLEKGWNQLSTCVIKALKFVLYFIFIIAICKEMTDGHRDP